MPEETKGQQEKKKRKCTACDGTGEDQVFGMRCLACQGTGVATTPPASDEGGEAQLKGIEFALIDLWMPVGRKYSDMTRRGHHLNARKIDSKQFYELVNEFRKSVLDYCRMLVTTSPTPPAGMDAVAFGHWMNKRGVQKATTDVGYWWDYKTEKLYTTAELYTIASGQPAVRTFSVNDIVEFIKSKQSNTGGDDFLHGQENAYEQILNFIDINNYKK